MHLKHLWYLRLILSEGSFAAAARTAGITQPAVTMAMQALEKELGTSLFDKSGRHKRPTQAAITAARRADELDWHIAKLGQQDPVASKWPQSELSETLRVGLAPAAALLYGPTIEATWSDREPDGLVRIVSRTAPEAILDVQRGDLDFAIVPRPRRYDAEDLACHPMHVSTPTVYSRNGHPLAKATSLMEISRVGWAVAGRAGTVGNVIEEAHRVRKLPAPRVLLQCADYMTLINAVAESDLLCVIPHPVLLRNLPELAISSLKIREGLPQYEVCLFYKALLASEESGAVAAVIDALINKPST